MSLAGDGQQLRDGQRLPRLEQSNALAAGSYGLSSRQRARDCGAPTATPRQSAHMCGETGGRAAQSVYCRPRAIVGRRDGARARLPWEEPGKTALASALAPLLLCCGRAVAAIIRLHHSSATAVLVIASPHFSSLPSTHLLHVPHPTFHNERNPSPRPPALDPLPGQAHHSRQYATDEPLQTICKLTPPAVDHTPHAHPASPTHELPSSFATYRKKAQQHGPLNISSGPQVGGHIGGAAGRSLGPIEAGKGMFFDRSELPERFQRLSWSQAEIDAIESGGASLFA